MKPGVLWPAAGVASVLAHAGGAAILLAAVAPQPDPQQETPEARMDLSTYQVEQSEAAPTEATGETAPEQEAMGTAVSGGEVPRSRAQEHDPSGTAAREVVDGAAPLSAGDLEATRPEALTATGANVPGVDPNASAMASLEPLGIGMPETAITMAPAEPMEARPSDVTVLNAAAGAEVIVDAIPETAAALLPSDAIQSDVQPSVAASTKLTAGAADPDVSEALGSVTVLPEAIGLARPSETDLSASPPEAGRVSPSVLSAEAKVAALAWSGGADAEVDPLSLAAIQSFMRPGEIPEADAVRDGIGGLLQSVPCARLQSVFDPATGALELRGHVPEEGLRAPVLEALQAQVGDAIPVRDNLRILPRPQCGALAGIAAVGLPQSTEQNTNPRVIGEGAHAQVYAFQDGQRLEFELQGPDYPAYFYIDYFDADGAVLHLQPNEFVPLESVDIDQWLQIGADRADKPSLNITVAPPFGQEIMVAFAASVPLFEELRPIQEPAGPYLEALKSKVANARSEHPDFKGEWVYFFVETRAR